MILDLHYRLRLVDDLFCSAAESLVSAAALEDWKSRSEVILKIRAYSQTLQIINADLCRIIEGKRAVFPADLSEAYPLLSSLRYCRNADPLPFAKKSVLAHIVLLRL